jgi:hypothetical protein
MWHSYTHKETLENGNKVSIRVRFHDYSGKFEVDDIGVVEKGKRKEIFVKSILTDEYSYRVLNSDNRRKAEIKRFVEVAGLDAINNALQAAWEDVKPKSITEEDYTIKG